MKNSNFLQFNGTNILFTDVQGITYIAISPICKALNIHEDRSLRNLKKDPILGPATSIQTYQVLGKAGFQARKLTCLPEKYVYGWIFSLQSDSKELIEYKKTCYDLLYNHFHGIIGKRKDFLIGVADTQIKINSLKKDLLENKTYLELLDLENIKKSFNSEMKKIDNEVMGQQEILFN